MVRPELDLIHLYKRVFVNAHYPNVQKFFY